MKTRKETLRRVLSYTVHARLLIVLSILFAMLSVALTLYLPVLTGNAVDLLIDAGEVDFDALLVILTRMAGRTPVPERESVRAFAAHGTTMILFLSAGLLPALRAELIEGGYPPDTPAAIVCRADLAKKFRADPIYVKGFGCSTDMLTPHYRSRDFDWTSFEALRNCSKMAYEMAGITNPRKDLDLAEVHDCFSITEMCIYEDFGFCERGTAYQNVMEGFFERDGGLPVNVDGGLKCFGHPVGASGIRMTYEIYKQLQYKVDNPARQLKDVHRGLSQTFGGPPQIAACMILGNEKG